MDLEGYSELEWGRSRGQEILMLADETSFASFYSLRSPFF